MEPVVPQTFRRKFVECRRRDAAAERRILPEPGVVEQDQHDVRRTPRRLYGLGELRRIGILVGLADPAPEVEVGSREHLRSARLQWISRRLPREGLGESAGSGQPAEGTTDYDEHGGGQR